MGPEWVIAVRLRDGQHQYYNASMSRQGQSEWTPRINQAQRFDTEAEAAKVGSRFDTNSTAKEYQVLRVPGRRRH